MRGAVGGRRAWIVALVCVWGGAVACDDDDGAANECIDNSCNLRCINEEAALGGYCLDGACRCAFATDGGSDLGADSEPADTGDAGLDGSDEADVGGPQQVCSGEDEVSFHPSEGEATVVLGAFVPGPDWRVRLSGPAELETLAGFGCLFKAPPGTYTVSLRDGETTVGSLTAELPEGETSLLAVHHNDGETGGLVVPLDLSAPDEGEWRLIFVNIAQDTLDTPLDVLAYPPGVRNPEGEPEVVAEALAFGDVAVRALPAQTVLFEYVPTGTTTDGTYANRSLECNAEAVVMVALILCDTAAVGDGGVCNNIAGAAYNLYSVEDVPCF